MMKNCQSAWSLLPMILALAACQSQFPWGDGDETRESVRRYGERMQKEWDELNEMKAQIRWDYDDPVHFEFADKGSLTVRHWVLEGGPGWETVRARLTYHNTTRQPMERVKVIMSVLDADGYEVSASRIVLEHPWGLPLAPGTMFSDEIKVPTAGAHKQPDGWHWKVAVETVPFVPIDEWGAPVVSPRPVGAALD